MSNARRRVDEHPLVDHLDVERRRLVDAERHEVRGEHVERVTLVLLRAVQGEVLVEVALEGEHLISGEGCGEVGAAEEPVVRAGVEHHVG